MKNFKRLTALLLALVMVFALSVSAFAATTDAELSGTVTVRFTKQYSENDDDVYTWDTERGVDLFETGSSVEVDLATLNGIALTACKAVYSEPTDHAMYNTVSVLDVVAAAALATNHSLQGGWDADPVIGAPGGYIHNIDNQELEYYSDSNGDGTYWAMGTGFVIGVAANATATPTFSSIYLSNVNANTLADGAVIYFDLGYFTYSSITF